MKSFISLLFLTLSSLALANTPAQIQRVDFTGFEFINYCNSEPVIVSGGELLIISRLDFGGDTNGVHLMNKVAGSFRGAGQTSGHEYLINVTAPSRFLPISNSNTNPVNGAGAATRVIHIEMVNLTEPGSGVSQVQAVLVYVVNGAGDGENKVHEVSFNCTGR